MLKAIYVGDQNLWGFMKNKVRPNWDWQQPVLTPHDFWDAIDNQSLDENTSVIVISPQFYVEALSNQNPQEREQEMNDFLGLVFSATQSALVILPNFYPNYQNQLESDLLAYAGQVGDDSGSLGKYWWMRIKYPMPDVDTAIREYINSEYSDKDTVRAIANEEGLEPMGNTASGPGIIANAVENISNRINGDDNQGNDNGEPKYTNNYKMKGQVITVTSSKGGSGKTTTSLGMGEWIAMSSIQAANKGLIPKPLRVCIVDLDVHDSQIGSVIGHWTPTILEVALNGVNEDTLNRAIIHDKASHCDFLLSPKLAKAADTIPSTKFEEVIKTLQYMYDIIVLDTSVDYTSELLSQFIYPLSDRIIFITTLDRRSVTGMRKWLVFVGSPEEKGGAGIDLARVSIVINRGQKGVSMTKGEIERSIRDSTQKVYELIDMTIPVEDQHVPELIGAIPDIPNGMLMKCGNDQSFYLTMRIPPFERGIAEYTRRVLPKGIRGKLKNLKFD